MWANRARRRLSGESIGGGLTKREWPILIVNLIYISILTVLAVTRLNFEFLLYVGVIVVLGVWIVLKQSSVRFGQPILWGLTLWGFLHMCGGILRIDGASLYEFEILSLVPSLHIFRYDQLVHTFGFGIATLIGAHLLRPHLRSREKPARVVYVLMLLMGAGMGALNEIVEFVAVLIMPETGVGGYENTMLDLCFNLLGGSLAVLWLARGAARR